MEAGYSTIDDESLSVKKDQKLMLFRFPKDVRYFSDILSFLNPTNAHIIMYF